MHKLAIYGAGGFGKEVAIMAARQGYEIVGYIDDDSQKNTIQDLSTVDDIIVAIAKPAIRSRIMTHWKDKRVPFSPLVHRSVELHSAITVGRGSIICAGTQITTDVQFGEFVIVNLNCTIGHDSKIGSFSALMPAVNISGNVTLGDRVFIGTGATILQGLTIGEDAIIGAGTMVTKNIPAGATVVGIPGRVIRSHRP